MTGMRVDDPDRPTCPACGVLTAVYTHHVGAPRRYQCNRCHRRGTAADFAALVPHPTGAWENMTIIAELPPAVPLRKNMACSRRYTDGRVRDCEYRADCEDNMARGGAALCEGVVVELCGAEREKVVH